MSTDLTHWHTPDGQTPSWSTEPSPCCKVQFLTIAERTAEIYAAQQADAVRDERVRIVTEALAAVQAYGDAATSVLGLPETELVDRVIDKCLDAIRGVGCICPQIEVTRFGDTKPRYVAGRDHRCGLHDMDGE